MRALLLLSIAAAMMPAPVASQEQTAAQPEHKAWDRESYHVLSGLPADAFTPEEPEGDERLDRIKERELAPGSYELERLLGLPRYSLTEASTKKVLDRQTRLVELEGGGISDLAQFGFDSPAATAVEDETLAEQDLRIVSSGLLELDLDTRSVHSSTRTEVTFRGRKLTADRMFIDVERRVINAAGDVVFEDIEGGGSVIRGSAMVYDYGRVAGRIWDADGERSVAHIVGNFDGTGAPSFEQLNERETVFANASLTTDNLPRPMYRVKGTEIIFLHDQRFIVLHAVFYVRDFPVLYFPIFSRSIGDPAMPWSLRFGQDNGGVRPLGNYAVLTYDHNFNTVEPSLTKPGEFEYRSRGRISPFLYYASPANGVGVEGRYDINRGRHRGEFFTFYSGSHDDRESELPAEDETQRYIANIKHRTQLTENLHALVNIDWISDPEVHLDYFDELLKDNERGRLSERRALGALTWSRDDYLARVVVETKERIARDRINNYGEPGDNDADFDQFVDDQPLQVVENEDGTQSLVGSNVLFDDEEFLTDVDIDEEQIDRDRFGRVTERRPELQISTSRLPIFSKPVFWSFDFNAFNNLDKGLNTLGTDDDSFVRGFDAYNSLVAVVNFSEQYSWYNKVGFGFGQAARDDGTYGLLDDVAGQVEFPARLENGLTFTDPETFLVGTEPHSLSEVSDNFVYADYESILNAEFNENLTGRLRYRFREGTEDSLGEYYETIGSRTTRDDLYNFRLRQNRVDGSLTYDFIYPRLTIDLNGGRNLDSEDDLTPGETIDFVNLSSTWRSLDDVWAVTGGVSRQTTQIRDPSDEFAFESATATAFGQIDYFPLHERYWAQLKGFYFKELNQDPINDFFAESIQDPTLGEQDRNNDDDVRFQIEPVVGMRVGPKWEVELQPRYDDQEEDFDRIRLIFQRDLNDAVLALGLNWELKNQNNDRGQLFEETDTESQANEDLEREFSFDVGLAFKLPNRDRFSGPLATETILNRRRSEIELGG